MALAHVYSALLSRILCAGLWFWKECHPWKKKKKSGLSPSLLTVCKSLAKSVGCGKHYIRQEPSHCPVVRDRRSVAGQMASLSGVSLGGVRNSAWRLKTLQMTTIEMTSTLTTLTRVNPTLVRVGKHCCFCLMDWLFCTGQVWFL